MLNETSHTLRLGASSYLNSAPLVWAFKYGSLKEHVELSEPVPAKCADLLAERAVDVALIPAIEYQRISDVEIVPSVCVASRRKVRSVLLATNLEDISDVRSVALDQSSRTSVALTKILFREFLGFEPRWVPSKPDLDKMLSANDAALIIGDPGMGLRGKATYLFDLAELWRQHTGLGFVFALWAFRSDDAPTRSLPDFSAARDEGLAHLSDIIQLYKPLLGLSEFELRSYLEDNISFSLDDELIRGLNLFYELAYKHKLTPGLKTLTL